MAWFLATLPTNLSPSLRTTTDGVVLSPSALGEAPLITDGGTGDPVCCTIWTLCGLPCINLPLLTGANQLPLGVQLIGALREDDRLLRTTRHFLADLHQRLNADT